MRYGTKDIKRLLAFWALPLCGTCLVIAAICHRLQLGTKDYTSSPLIGIEIILMIIVMLLVFVQPFHVIVCCIKKQWRKCVTAVINTFIGISSIMAAMIIDAATLIYMT